MYSEKPISVVITAVINVKSSTFDISSPPKHEVILMNKSEAVDIYIQ